MSKNKFNFTTQNQNEKNRIHPLFIYMHTIEAQVTTAADLQGGTWTQVLEPEKVLSNTSWIVTSLKLETQYKGQEIEPEKALQVFVGTKWKFSAFAGMDSPKNIITISKSKETEVAYNIGMGSLFIEIPNEKLWQGNIFTKGNLVCYVHNGYESDYLTCLITFKKQ